MKELILDAKTWETQDDFYNSFFKAVGAPKWHGRNFNALNDSIGAGQINQIEVPYIIKIINSVHANEEIKKIISDFKNLITNLKSEGTEIDIKIE